MKIAWTSAPYYGADSSASLGVSVSCSSARNCWGAGSTSISPLVSRSIFVHWNGRHWASVKPPKLKDSALYGINCSSTGCWAVGDVGTFYRGTHSLVLHWNGSQWSRATRPSRKGSLFDVSCSSDKYCWAVGTLDSNSTSLNLVENWNGSAWSSL